MSGFQLQLHTRSQEELLQIPGARSCLSLITQSLVLIPDMGVCEEPQVIPVGTHAAMLALRKLGICKHPGALRGSRTTSPHSGTISIVSFSPHPSVVNTVSLDKT